MRLFGAFLAVTGVLFGIWIGAVYIMRNTYFRPLAPEGIEAGYYAIARDCADRLAKDLFYPSISASLLLIFTGFLAVATHKKLLASEVVSEPKGPLSSSAKRSAP
jgi:hypothetical protein